MPTHPVLYVRHLKPFQNDVFFDAIHEDYSAPLSQLSEVLEPIVPSEHPKISHEIAVDTPLRIHDKKIGRKDA